MIASGEPVDSVYLKGDEALQEHERRNGYDRPWGPNGVMAKPKDKANYLPESGRHVVV